MRFTRELRRFATEMSQTALFFNRQSSNAAPDYGLRRQIEGFSGPANPIGSAVSKTYRPDPVYFVLGIWKIASEKPAMFNILVGDETI